MKRLTLLTVLLVVVGLTAGFALEVKPAFTLTGSATLSWGYDLDNSTHGFDNTASGDLVITLMAADGTDTHKGEGDLYGEITIANVELFWTDGVATAGIADADVSAKLVGMGGNLAIGIAWAPDLIVDKAPIIEGTADDIVDVETTLSTDYPGDGTYISYNMAPILVGFEVISENPWTTNVAGAYAFALDVTGTFTPITIALGANMGMNYATNPIGIGAKVDVAIAPLALWVGVDGQMLGAAFSYEAAAGATFTLATDTTAVVSLAYGTNVDGLDVKFVFTEPAAGLVPDLDLTLTAYVLDITSVAGMEYELIVDGGYKMGVLYPNFTVTYGHGTEPIDVLKVMVGVDATMIPLTTLGLYWTSDNMALGAGNMGTVVASAKVTY